MNDPGREARRWYLQALDDLKFVRWVRDEGEFFDKGCFLAQQAGEKALKACLYGFGLRRVFGHSLLEFVQELTEKETAFGVLLNPARRLDRFYIAAQYPNGLPGGCPYEAFTAEDLERASEDAAQIIDQAGTFLSGRGISTPT